MPIKRYQGRYQAPRGTRRRRRRRQGSWIIPILLMVIVAALAGILAWVTWPGDGNQPTEPVQVLELPDSVMAKQPLLSTIEQGKPEDFVSGLEGTGISVSFVEPLPKEPGEHAITLRFTKDGAQCLRSTTFRRFRLNPSVTVDISEGRKANVRDFVPDETLEAALAVEQEILLDHCVNRQMKILCGGRTYTVCYIVKESVPPVGTPETVTAAIGTVPEPSLLVKDIRDDSSVKVTYLEPPKLTVVGSMSVTLVLTDLYGNSSQVTSQINVVPAADAPKFTGLSELHIQVGDTISYKAGVTATDPEDGTVNFTVDTAGVDRNQTGTYTVYYSATDTDGNTTIVPRTIVVLNITEAAVESLAQAVLDKIITPTMTRDQKIFAVYKYTKANVQFVGSSDKTDIAHGAYEGFTTGKGDCYTYYAMNVVLLNMLGIENLEVRRIGGTSNHWWNLVQYEDGKWYHVDSCPHAIAVENIAHWKMTEADIARYTADPAVAARRPNFYVYDKTLPVYEGLDIAP